MADLLTGIIALVFLALIVIGAVACVRDICGGLEDCQREIDDSRGLDPLCGETEGGE